ncbi:MAG TPA: MFS transporter, partial [Anaerolineae bacterium]
ISVFVFTGALGTLFGGALADRLGRKTVMILSLAVVWPLLAVFLRASGALQVIALAIAGASLISASSLTVVMAQELLPDNVGLASGLTLGLGFGAGGLGAAALGALGDAHGIGATMQALAWLPVPLVLASLLLPGRTVSPAWEDPSGGETALSGR